MNAVTGEQMRCLEHSLFAKGVDAATLMAQAGWGIACAVRKFFPNPGTVHLYLGKGHNAGDALCAAQHLRRWGWQIELHAVYPEIEWAVLTRQQLRALEGIPQPCSSGHGPTLIMEALLGIGAKGALREPIRAAAFAIREQRIVNAIPVIALDLPTGVDADIGSIDPAAVIADFTFFIGAPKIGLLRSSAVNHVGRLEYIPLDNLPLSDYDSGLRLITPGSFPQSLPLRAHDFHKGDAGRVTVVAGSCGMEGAALLCATAAMRAGAGLVTLWVGENAHAAVVARACPALMVRSYADWKEISLGNADALVMGPGLGALNEGEFDAMVDLLGKHQGGAVLDADALNAIARFQGHQCLQAQHVITPHPGEFARLAPLSAERSREDGCAHFTQFNPSVLLLKGARTLVQQRGKALYHNGTGNAGMASAGMGDVLAGVIAGLQAQGMNPLTSACAGAWICGRAAEISVSSGRQSALSLVATDLFETLGAALSEWQAG
jgi:hydroxyethylthiazole kinase-like uncharacterized protein yjeF